MSVRLKRYVRAVGVFRIAARNSVSTSNGQESRASTIALGLEGFEDLRKYIKQGCELCKEIAIIAAERSDLETLYSRGLQRLSSKLAKACSGGAGTLAAAWGVVATEMQQESEAHRSVAVSLLEDICKPLRILAETHSKDRKPIEHSVDRATRDMVDKRAEEQKFKQKTFTYTHESETSHEQIIQSRLNKEKEKDIAKMEKRLQALKDHARKSGKQYYDACLAAEMARAEWDAALYKGSNDLRDMEAERLQELHKQLKVYKSQVESLAPALAQVCEKLKQAADSVDFEKDLTMALDGRGYRASVTEQFLFETYAENVENSMSKERRRQTLNLYIYYLSQDIEKETKSRQGMERLMEIYSTKPSYASLEAQEDVRAKMKQACALLNFLDASHYKLSCTLATVSEQPRPIYKHDKYMEVVKDKMGLRQTVLRMPVGLVAEAFDPDLYSARGAGDGSTITEHHHYSLANDEDYGEVFDAKGGLPTKNVSEESTASHEDDIFLNEDDFDSCDFPNSKPIATCRAVYDYAASNSSELSISKGDLLFVHEKHADGWWYGEHRDNWGVFPASYVKEISNDESVCMSNDDDHSQRPETAGASHSAEDSAPRRPPIAVRPARPLGSPHDSRAAARTLESTTTDVTVSPLPPHRTAKQRSMTPMDTCGM